MAKQKDSNVSTRKSSAHSYNIITSSANDGGGRPKKTRTKEKNIPFLFCSRHIYTATHHITYIHASSTHDLGGGTRRRATADVMCTPRTNLPNNKIKKDSFILHTCFGAQTPGDGWFVPVPITRARIIQYRRSRNIFFGVVYAAPSQDLSFTVVSNAERCRRVLVSQRVVHPSLNGKRNRFQYQFYL